METGRVCSVCVLRLNLLFFRVTLQFVLASFSFYVLCLHLFHHCIACVHDYPFASPFHVIAHDTRHVLWCVFG